MVDTGVIVGIVVGVVILALLIAACTVLVLYFCIYKEKRKKFKKGHVKGQMTMNGAPIIYNKPHQPMEVFSTTDNVFEVPPPVKKAASVYSLPNGSHYGGGGSVIMQPAYRNNSYDTTDSVFLTMPPGGYHQQHHKRKPTKAKRLLSDEIWRSRTKSLVRRDHSKSMDHLDSRPVQVQYPASTIGYEPSSLQYPTQRTRSASEYGGSHYGGSHYGSTPSILRVHKAVAVKTKNKKTVYVIDNSTVAQESIVMAPSGRVSPPLVSQTRTLPVVTSAARPRARSYVTRNHANTSFDLIDHTNTHLFDSESQSRGGVAYAMSAPQSPRRDDSLKPHDYRDPADLHLVWTDDMRSRLEQEGHGRRHGSEASSMASLPRRQRAPAEHLYQYDTGRQTLTAL